MKSWKNWSGSVRVKPENFYTPASEQELTGIVNDCREVGKTIRVVGAGHSFTPLVASEGAIVSLDRMNRVLEVNKEEGWARVQAGIRLKDLGIALHEQGLAMENLGDIDSQSVAGAIGTGTHGTGMQFGGLATQVKALRILTASGEIRECSQEQNTDLFKAAQVSLGALGIITEVVLNLIPAYKLKFVSGKSTLDECLDQLDELKANRNFEFYWFPFTRKVQTKVMNHTKEKNKGGGIFAFLNDILLENGVFWILSLISRTFPRTAKAMSRVSAWGISTGTSINYSHKVLATSRLVRFQEMEYNLPAEHFQEAIREWVEYLNKSKHRVHFPCECRFAKGDDIWLSPAYQRDSAYIAVHMYRGMPHEAYFQAAEAIFSKYGGRPHWGKMHNRSASELADLYPKWKDFLQMRAELDPKGLFLNAYLKELFGLEISS